MRLDTFEPAGGSESPLYHHATELVAYRPLRRYLPRMPARRPSSSERHGLRAILGVIFGAFIGFFLATQIRNTFLGREGNGNSSCAAMGIRNSPAITGIDDDPVFAGMQSGDTVHNSSRALLFVGVMTAQKYLDTRARAVYETWGRELPGRMAFFSSANSVTSANIPLVRLAGVDDSYPPQKKSFLMLKYMYEHFGDKFEWFMRADDDVYVRPERLDALLRSIDSRKPQFIGQAGRGSQEEFGLLSLEYDENFCMGGPGVLMSRATLARVAPHVSYCLRNLYTTHEDVELGRCVQRFAGIPCTWSYEMQTILYHNSSGSEAFTGKLKYKEVHRAITLHPVKQYKHLYRVHNYMRALNIQDLQHRALLLRRDINSMQTLMGKSASSQQQYLVENLLGLAPSLHKYRANRYQDVITWEFFTHALYSATNANPRRRIESALREGLDDVIREIMEMTNTYSRQRGRILDFKEVLYGYHRINPLAGQELVLDMQLVYRKYRGRKMTIPVRRHSYLQRAFVGLEVRETSDGLPVDPSNQESRNRRAVTDDFMGGVLGPAARLVRRHEPRVKHNPARDKLITFLVPLSGRLTTFKRFAALYEEVCLQGGQLTSLVLVLFPSDDVADTVAVVTNLQQKYPQASLSVLPVFVPFARGLALQLGAAHVQAQNPDSILFFIDVDVVFTSTSLQRVRLNTIRNRQSYYPVVFSEFDPGVVYGNGTISAPNHFLISDDTGYWRNYGFGIASVYPSDLNTAGGFDTGIRGWGKEDVDLYDKFVRSNVSVFRAADPGLVHVFHIVECDSSLDAPQLAMCHGTRANTYAGVSQLTRIIDKDTTILQNARENNKGRS